jgi:hypothetical protein
MSEEKTIAQTSRHVAGIYLALGDEKGREIVGVRLNSGAKEIQIHLSPTGRLSGVWYDGKKLK